MRSLGARNAVANKKMIKAKKAKEAEELAATVAAAQAVDPNSVEAPPMQP